MSLKCCLSVAYYIQTWSYRGILHFVYLCSRLLLGLLMIWSIFLYDFQYHCNHIISLKQSHLYTWAFLFSLRVLLSFCLIVCQFQPCVAYKSVAYKKECILTCLTEVTCFSGLQIEIHQIFWSISSYRYSCIDSRIQKPLWKCLFRCKRMFQKEK